MTTPRRTKKALGARSVGRKPSALSPEQLRQLALHRRAHADGQRLMRRRLHAILKDLLFDAETTAEDILDLIGTMPLAPAPAWTQPQKARS